MKRFSTRSAALVLAAALLTSSCIGSFTLTDKLMTWNRSVGNKFLNEVVFFAFWVLPVYEVCALADMLVINSIEFWSGNNPMASQKKVVEGRDGKYLVERDADGYTISTVAGEEQARLDYDTATRTWSVTLPGGEPMTLFTYVDDTHVAVPTPGGAMTLVELTPEGVDAYRTMHTPLFALAQ